jgi:hypothetical protein
VAAEESSDEPELPPASLAAGVLDNDEEPGEDVETGEEQGE